MSQAVEKVSAQYRGPRIEPDGTIFVSKRVMDQSLDDPATWSRSRGLVTLRQYVAVNLTAVADSVGVVPEISTDPFLQPKELTPRELKTFVLEDLFRSIEVYPKAANFRKMTLQWISEVVNDTPKGQGFLEEQRRGRQEDIDAVASGRHKLAEDRT